MLPIRSMSRYQSRRHFKAESHHTNTYRVTKQWLSGLKMPGMHVSKGN